MAHKDVSPPQLGILMWDDPPYRVRRVLIDFLLEQKSLGISHEQNESTRRVFERLATEFKEAADDDVLFWGSDGSRVVVGLMYPREGLGADGPLILPSSDESTVLVAFSVELLQEQVRVIEGNYADDAHRSFSWNQYLNRLAFEALRSEQPDGVQIASELNANGFSS